MADEKTQLKPYADSRAHLVRINIFFDQVQLVINRLGGVINESTGVVGQLALLALAVLGLLYIIKGK